MANSSHCLSHRWEQSWDMIEIWDQIRKFSVHLVHCVCVECEITWLDVPTNFRYPIIQSPLQNKTKGGIKIFLERYKDDFLTKFGYLVPEDEPVTLENFAIHCKNLFTSIIFRNVDKELPASLLNAYSEHEIARIKQESKMIMLFVHVLHMAKYSALFYQRGVHDAPKFAMLMIDECLRQFLKIYDADHTHVVGDELFNFFDWVACCTIRMTAQAENINVRSVDMNLRRDNVTNVLYHDSNVNNNLMDVHDIDMNRHGFSMMDMHCVDMIEMHHATIMDDQPATMINQGSSNFISRGVQNMLDQTFDYMLAQALTYISHKVPACMLQLAAHIMNEHHEKDQTSAHEKNQAHANLRDQASANIVDEGLENVKDQAPANMVDEEPGNVKDHAPANMMHEEPGKVKDQAPANVVDEGPANVMDEAPASLIDDEHPNLMYLHPSNMMHLHSPNMMYPNLPNMASVYHPNIVHVPLNMMNVFQPNVMNVFQPNVMNVFHPNVMNVYHPNIISAYPPNMIYMTSANSTSLPNTDPTSAHGANMHLNNGASQNFHV